MKLPPLALFERIQTPSWTLRCVSLLLSGELMIDFKDMEFLILFIFSLSRKVAPQNIMYDRRVVRGNTFAALVIPVSKLQICGPIDRRD